MPRDRTDILASLTSKGFELKQGKRDHDVLFFKQDGLIQAVFTRVSRGSQYKTIDDSLLGRMSRQLKISRRQFDDLVDCPMTAEDYQEVLRDNGVIVARGSQRRS